MDNPDAQTALDFVRFCMSRLTEPNDPAWTGALYDEMCRVARKRLFRGWGYAELADHGIVLSIPGFSALRRLAQEVQRSRFPSHPPCRRKETQ